MSGPGVTAMPARSTDHSQTLVRKRMLDSSSA